MGDAVIRWRKLRAKIPSFVRGGDMSVWLGSGQQLAVQKKKCEQAGSQWNSLQGERVAVSGPVPHRPRGKIREGAEKKNPSQLVGFEPTLPEGI